MPRNKKRRPNWPYRLAWLTMIGLLLLYLLVQTLIGAATFGSRSYGTDWGLALVAACLDVTVAVLFVSVGASIGSFLNVVAYRVPLGRFIGGHSGCPFCQTPIDGSDNVPVLAWIKLRGRCRACRLPISIQYPLVEFTVALVFFLVYVSEFSVNASNLPAQRPGVASVGLMRVVVNSTLVLRIVIYLFAMCGLISAALIAVKRKRVPLKLYAWSLAPLCIATLVFPQLIVVQWRELALAGFVETRLDVLANFLCGAAAAILVARSLAPLVYTDFDRSLLSSNLASSGARQFIGAMGVVGCLLGWQAIVPMCWVLLTVACVACVILRRFRAKVHLGDLTVWVWLGLLVFRMGWSTYSGGRWLPAGWPDVVHHLVGAILLAPMAVAFRTLSAAPSVQPPASAATLASKAENLEFADSECIGAEDSRQPDVSDELGND